MFHSEVFLDEVCGSSIDRSPALKCLSRSTVLVRIVPRTDRLALLLCALWKGLIRSAIPSLLTFSFVGQGKDRREKRACVCVCVCRGLFDSDHFADKAVSTG